jgi:membrane-bound metal-dependent hydrolase YbcI (DUF457 family)
MFVGHFAAGFAARLFAPKVNLGWAVTAAALADLLWTLFLLLGLEHARVVPGITPGSPLDLYDYPWSHSLALDALWALLAAFLWWAWRREGRGAVAIGLAVLSHWVLDWASHVPDLPLWPGGAERLGLGLWRSIPATVLVEGGLWAAALLAYARSTRARDRIGRWAFWSYAAVMSLLYAASFLGPPPPDIRILAWSNLASLLFLVWPGWFDRHRGTAAAAREEIPALPSSGG